MDRTLKEDGLRPTLRVEEERRDTDNEGRGRRSRRPKDPTCKERRLGPLLQLEDKRGTTEEGEVEGLRTQY